MICLLPRIGDFVRLPFFITCHDPGEFELHTGPWFPYITDDGLFYRDHDVNDRDLYLFVLGEFRFLGLKLGDTYHIRGPFHNPGV